jgi:hypothetical protein
VGQVGNLPPIENRPTEACVCTSKTPIFNRQQDAILLYKGGDVCLPGKPLFWRSNL